MRGLPNQSAVLDDLLRQLNVADAATTDCLPFLQAAPSRLSGVAWFENHDLVKTLRAYIRTQCTALRLEGSGREVNSASDAAGTSPAPESSGDEVFVRTSSSHLTASGLDSSGGGGRRRQVRSAAGSSNQLGTSLTSLPSSLSASTTAAVVASDCATMPGGTSAASSALAPAPPARPRTVGAGDLRSSGQPDGPPPQMLATRRDSHSSVAPTSHQPSGRLPEAAAAMSSDTATRIWRMEMLPPWEKAVASADTTEVAPCVPLPSPPQDAPATKGLRRSPPQKEPPRGPVAGVEAGSKVPSSQLEILKFDFDDKSKSPQEVCAATTPHLHVMGIANPGESVEVLFVHDGEARSTPGGGGNHLGLVRDMHDLRRRLAFLEAGGKYASTDVATDVNPTHAKGVSGETAHVVRVPSQEDRWSADDDGDTHSAATSRGKAKLDEGRSNSSGSSSSSVRTPPLSTCKLEQTAIECSADLLVPADDYCRVLDAVPAADLAAFSGWRRICGYLGRLLTLPARSDSIDDHEDDEEGCGGPPRESALVALARVQEVGGAEHTAAVVSLLSTALLVEGSAPPPPLLLVDSSPSSGDASADGPLGAMLTVWWRAVCDLPEQWNLIDTDERTSLFSAVFDVAFLHAHELSVVDPSATWASRWSSCSIMRPCLTELVASLSAASPPSSTDDKSRSRSYRPDVERWLHVSVESYDASAAAAVSPSHRDIPPHLVALLAALPAAAYAPRCTTSIKEGRRQLPATPDLCSAGVGYAMMLQQLRTTLGEAHSTQVTLGGSRPAVAYEGSLKLCELRIQSEIQRAVAWLPHLRVDHRAALLGLLKRFPSVAGARFATPPALVEQHAWWAHDTMAHLVMARLRRDESLTSPTAGDSTTYAQGMISDGDGGDGEGVDGVDAQSIANAARRWVRMSPCERPRMPTRVANLVAQCFAASRRPPRHQVAGVVSRGNPDDAIPLSDERLAKGEAASFVASYRWLVRNTAGSGRARAAAPFGDFTTYQVGLPALLAALAWAKGSRRVAALWPGAATWLTCVSQVLSEGGPRGGSDRTSAATEDAGQTACLASIRDAVSACEVTDAVVSQESDRDGELATIIRSRWRALCTLFLRKDDASGVPSATLLLRDVAVDLQLVLEEAPSLSGRLAQLGIPIGSSQWSADDIDHRRVETIADVLLSAASVNGLLDPWLTGEQKTWTAFTCLCVARRLDATLPSMPTGACDRALLRAVSLVLRQRLSRALAYHITQLSDVAEQSEGEIPRNGSSESGLTIDVGGQQADLALTLCVFLSPVVND